MTHFGGLCVDGFVLVIASHGALGVLEGWIEGRVEGWKVRAVEDTGSKDGDDERYYGVVSQGKDTGIRKKINMISDAIARPAQPLR